MKRPFDWQDTVGEHIVLTHLEWIAFLFVPLAMREVDASLPPPQAATEGFYGWSEALTMGLQSHNDYEVARATFIQSLAWLAVYAPGGVSFGRLHFGGRGWTM